MNSRRFGIAFAPTIPRRYPAMARDSTRCRSIGFGSAVSLAESGVWRPLIDIYRTRSGWLLKCDLAGVLPEDVKLTLAGSRLTIRGVRKDCCIEEGCCHYRMEISYSRFERTIELPATVEPAQLSAEFWHGFLLVRID